MHDLVELENNDSVFRMEEGAEKLDICFGYYTLYFSKYFLPNG